MIFFCTNQSNFHTTVTLSLNNKIKFVLHQKVGANYSRFTRKCSLMLSTWFRKSDTSLLTLHVCTLNCTPSSMDFNLFSDSFLNVFMQLLKMSLWFVNTAHTISDLFGYKSVNNVGSAFVMYLGYCCINFPFHSFCAEFPQFI